MADGSQAAQSKSLPGADPLVGRVINDRFRITAVLARGGMGKIYRAEQAPLGRVCALKVLSPSASGAEQEFHKRFFLEASIASKLTHPNTVTIFDYGRTDDDIYYMAMEYLEGHTLQRAIRSAGALSEERAVHIARQICRALREAHALGVIHRDLKPANIFLVEHGDETDFVKVLDFGLVKDVSDDKGEELTRVGVFVGSPKYMSPEQIRGERVDARTDIYALGTMLYEMVVGKVPFVRATTVQVMIAQVNEPPPPIRDVNPNARISAAFEETVARCLAKDPEQRFRSMDEVLTSLKRVGGSGPAATFTGEARVASPASGELPLLEGTGSGFTPETAASGSRSLANPEGRPASTATAGTSLIPAPPAPVGPSVVPPATPATAASSVVPAPFMSGAPGLERPSSDAPGIESRAGGRFKLRVPWLVLAAAAVTVGTLLALRGEGQPAAAALTPGEPPAANADNAQATPQGGFDKRGPVSSTETAATPADAVTVRVTTDPEGAEVRENSGVLCTSTPCDILYSGAEADPAKQHKLTVGLDGHRPETRLIRIGDSPVSLRLSKWPDGGRAP